MPKRNITITMNDLCGTYLALFPRDILRYHITPIFKHYHFKINDCEGIVIRNGYKTQYYIG